MESSSSIVVVRGAPPVVGTEPGKLRATRRVRQQWDVEVTGAVVATPSVVQRAPMVGAAIPESSKYLSLPEATFLDSTHVRRAFRTRALVFLWRLTYKYKPLRELNANCVQNSVFLYDRYNANGRPMLDIYHAQITATVALWLSGLMTQDMDIVEMCLLDREGYNDNDRRLFAEIQADMVGLADHRLVVATVAGWLTIRALTERDESDTQTLLSLFASDCMCINAPAFVNMSIERCGRLCRIAVQVISNDRGFPDILSAASGEDQRAILDLVIAITVTRKDMDPDHYLTRRYMKILDMDQVPTGRWSAEVFKI